MKALHELNAAEADRWIMEMRRSLADHAAKLQWSTDADSVRAAINTHLMLLREMAELQPAKRAKIEALIRRYAEVSAAPPRRPQPSLGSV